MFSHNTELGKITDFNFSANWCPSCVCCSHNLVSNYFLSQEIFKYFKPYPLCNFIINRVFDPVIAHCQELSMLRNYYPPFNFESWLPDLIYVRFTDLKIFLLIVLIIYLISFLRLPGHDAHKIVWKFRKPSKSLLLCLSATMLKLFVWSCLCMLFWFKNFLEIFYHLLHTFMLGKFNH